MFDNYSWANGIVLSGQKIIDRGEIVSQDTYNILESLRKESIKRSESIGTKTFDAGGAGIVCQYLHAVFHALPRLVP